MPAAMTWVDKVLRDSDVADRQHEGRATSFGQQLGRHGEAEGAEARAIVGSPASFEELCHV